MNDKSKNAEPFETRENILGILRGMYVDRAMHPFDHEIDEAIEDVEAMAVIEFGYTWEEIENNEIDAREEYMQALPKIA